MERIQNEQNLLKNLILKNIYACVNWRILCVCVCVWIFFYFLRDLKHFQILNNENQDNLRLKKVIHYHMTWIHHLYFILPIYFCYRFRLWFLEIISLSFVSAEEVCTCFLKVPCNQREAVQNGPLFQPSRTYSL